MLERKLADAEISEEEQDNILKYLEKKETEYMRIQRHKMGADDFEPLTMIGKGAFGEVFISLWLPLPSSLSSIECTKNEKCCESLQTPTSMLLFDYNYWTMGVWNFHDI